MANTLYRYHFGSKIPAEDIEASLLLSILSTESLHGASQVRLDTAHYLDDTKHACVIDASTQVGCDLNRLFLGFLSREFGDDSFSVERIEKSACKSSEDDQ
ncbi:hypothetical protein [Bythopirellula polymerisocia]|uniref:hypothetical protein n=1 Tax=Bythopirellula polymerisocia TaxID=2528003 RepID=UPI0011B39D5C|nr:hypothetical protein [Bythopirellula polymerisocia]